MRCTTFVCKRKGGECNRTRSRVNIFVSQMWIALSRAFQKCLKPFCIFFSLFKFCCLSANLSEGPCLSFFLIGDRADKQLCTEGNVIEGHVAEYSFNASLVQYVQSASRWLRQRISIVREGTAVKVSRLRLAAMALRQAQILSDASQGKVSVVGPFNFSHEYSSWIKFATGSVFESSKCGTNFSWLRCNAQCFCVQ